MQDHDMSKLGRRDFLRVVGFGAGIAATAAAAASLVATEAAAAESMTEAKKKRYNADSEEVKTFYRVNGY